MTQEHEFRLVPTALARAAIGDDGNTMVGYAAVFDTPAQIDGWDGSFQERIDPKAFNRTIANNGDKVKALFNHGMDPSIGSKPLGKPTKMEPDDHGLYVEVPLDETSYNADIKASLRSGALDGMSFMFDVVKEEWNEEHTERNIKEVRLYEFGPVTWPAYESTSVGIRSKGVYGKPELVTPGPGARDNAPPEPARDTSESDAKKQRLEELEAELKAWEERGGVSVGSG